MSFFCPNNSRKTPKTLNPTPKPFPLGCGGYRCIFGFDTTLFVYYSCIAKTASCCTSRVAILSDTSTFWHNVGVTYAIFV